MLFLERRIDCGHSYYPEIHRKNQNELHNTFQRSCHGKNQILQDLSEKKLSVSSALNQKYSGLRELSYNQFSFDAKLPWDHLTAKKHKDIVMNNVRTLE